MTNSEEYPLRLRVFRFILENPRSDLKEVAELLDANYGSVKDACAKLSKEGLLKREGRGVYSPNIPMILLDLYSRIEKLEGGGQKR